MSVRATRVKSQQRTSFDTPNLRSNLALNTGKRAVNGSTLRQIPQFRSTEFNPRMTRLPRSMTWLGGHFASRESIFLLIALRLYAPSFSFDPRSHDQRVTQYLPSQGG